MNYLEFVKKHVKERFSGIIRKNYTLWPWQKSMMFGGTPTCQHSENTIQINFISSLVNLLISFCSNISLLIKMGFPPILFYSSQSNSRSFPLFVSLLLSYFSLLIFYLFSSSPFLFPPASSLPHLLSSVLYGHHVLLQFCCMSVEAQGVEAGQFQILFQVRFSDLNQARPETVRTVQTAYRVSPTSFTASKLNIYTPKPGNSLQICNAIHHPLIFLGDVTYLCKIKLEP